MNVVKVFFFHLKCPFVVPISLQYSNIYILTHKLTLFKKRERKDKKESWIFSAMEGDIEEIPFFSRREMVPLFL